METTKQVKQNKFFKHNNKVSFWYLVFGLLIQAVVLGFHVYSIVETFLYKDGNLWIHFLQYFTNQSNFLVTFFVIYYFISPKSKVFYKNNLLIYTTAYIVVTFLVYNCILLPSDLPHEALGWASSMFKHTINPLYMVGLFTMIVVFKKHDNRISKWYWSEIYGLIYPTIYVIYAVILPFISNYSVYGTMTNLNPDLIINGVAGSTFNLVYIFGVYIAFAIFIPLFWFILNKCVFKNNKKIIKKRN